jgi:hypothetical protein
MADTEIENTLREIRERVIAASAAQPPRPAPGETLAAYDPAEGPTQVRGEETGEALSRMSANLSTTGRAWSRLPPLLTKRRGAAARLELWLKRFIKRAAHWFTWEQVNFNSAAHNALTDAREALEAHANALSAHEGALAALREELSRLRADVESGAARASELGGRISSAESTFGSRLAELRQALASGLDGLRGEQSASAEGLRDELRDRAAGLLEEQRVCFRQLSLEAGELAVAHDRARRAVESRLETLEKTVTGDEQG